MKDQLSLPVIAAPMFLVSGPELVIEACRSGIIGSFPLLNARTSEILDEWMKRISDELEQARFAHPEQRIAPWAVNLIVHRTNTRYDADVELIKKHQPPIVITSLGAPGSIVEMVHAYGGLVFSDVSKLAHARKAAQTGVDGLILVCGGAGGHAGVLNPFAFVRAVKEFWNGLTILAGSISSGQDIAAAQMMGADLSYMGTRFIATTESTASEEYKEMLVASNAEDLLYTDAFSGVPANYLVPSIKKAGIDPQQLTKKETIDFSTLNASEAKAWKDIWSAGQGVGTIKDIVPIADVVAALREEYEQALASLSDQLPFRS
ncbi:nitronate monooxygenase [Aneurinibacillus sp. BA2021]|nr:nitronate monooxygenase [Aneurinibacillus sp. BA2021]